MSSEAPRAGLGESVGEAQASEFFRWFHLADSAEMTAIAHHAPDIAGRTWRRFRPSGPSFHHLVELAVGVDGDERISAAWLDIDRAFIADSRIRPFARDIASSFLNWILPADASVALAPEIDAISQFCDGERVVIARSSARPASMPSWGKQLASGAMADVFIGNAARAEQTIRLTRIVFENLVESLAPGVSSKRSPTLRAVSDMEQDAWLRIAICTAGGA